MNVNASVERRVEARPEAVYAVIADFRDHHSKILPPQFSEVIVEEGGTGAGTVVHFTLTLGGRPRTSRVRVDEPEPGRVLVEREVGGNMLTTFTVDALPNGCSHVTITTSWQASGLRGVVERLFAPRMLRGLYADELRRLDRYVRERARTAPRIRKENRAFVV